MHFGMVPKHLRVVAVPLRFAVMQRFICSIYPMLVQNVILFHYLIYILAQSFSYCRWDLCQPHTHKPLRKYVLSFTAQHKARHRSGHAELSAELNAHSVHLQKLKRGHWLFPQGLNALYIKHLGALQSSKVKYTQSLNFCRHNKGL